MTTPAVCPECGAKVVGVDLRPGGESGGGERTVPDASEYVLLPCGHPATDPEG